MTFNSGNKNKLKVTISSIFFFFVSLTLSLNVSAHKVYIPDAGGSFSCMINASKVCGYPIPFLGTGSNTNIFSICFAESNQTWFDELVREIVLGGSGLGVFDGQSAIFIEHADGDVPDCSLRFREMFSTTAGIADLRSSGSKPPEQYQCGLGNCVFYHQRQIRIWSQRMSEFYSGFLGENDNYRKAFEILVRHEIGHYLGLPHNSKVDYRNPPFFSAMYRNRPNADLTAGMLGVFRQCEIDKLVAYRYDTIGQALGEDIEFIRVDTTQNTARCVD